MSQNIFRTFDRIKLKLDAETRYHSPVRYPPDGTEATIVGWYNTNWWVGRAWEFGVKPGRYFDNGAAIIRFDDGTGMTGMNTVHFELVDETETALRRAAFHATNELLEPRRWHPPTLTWLEPLPELPFYEMDRVSFRWRDSAGFAYGNTLYGTVRHIAYDKVGAFCSDMVTPYPIYNIDMDKGGSTAIEQQRLTLLHRGNVWKKYHNESIVFSTLREEMSFAEALGETEDVRNPATLMYRFSYEELRYAVNKDIADCGTMQPDPLKIAVSVGATRFKDRELGERVRAAFLAEDGLTYGRQT